MLQHQLFYFLVLLCGTNAFQPRIPIDRRSKLIASAYYFGMDGNEDDHTSTSATAVETLNNQRASLARVVAAFPPEGHTLDLNHIEDVTVLEVDEDHMQVQVTVCENESCSAITFPFTFPRRSPTDGSSLEEFALHNLEDLDHQAELLLKQTEWDEINHEYLAEIDRQRDELMHPHSHIDLPEWWIPPPTDLVQECDTLHQLLNEDEFAADMCAMAQSSIGQSVERASVFAVGLAGIVMRARLTSGNVVETFISFADTAGSVDDLRDSVEAAMNGGAQQ